MYLYILDGLKGSKLKANFIFWVNSPFNVFSNMKAKLHMEIWQNHEYLLKQYWHTNRLTFMCGLLESLSSGLGSPALCFLQQLKRSSTTMPRSAGHSSRNFCPTAFRYQIISSRMPPFCMFASRNAWTSFRSEEPWRPARKIKEMQKETKRWLIIKPQFLYLTPQRRCSQRSWIHGSAGNQVCCHTVSPCYSDSPHLHHLQTFSVWKSSSSQWDIKEEFLRTCLKSNIQVCAARFQSNVFSLLGFTQHDKTRNRKRQNVF